ncbi:MAG: hypothetical protein WBM41_07300 [Arenicellales bacterium]
MFRTFTPGGREDHHSWDQNGGGNQWNQNGGGNHWNQNGGGSGGLERLILFIKLFLNIHNNHWDKNGGGNGGTNGGGNSVPDLSATSGPIALALLSGIIGIGIERRRRKKSSKKVK